MSFISPSHPSATSILVIGHDYYRRMVRGIKWGLKSVLTPKILPLLSTHLSIISDVGGFWNKGQWAMKGGGMRQELKDSCVEWVREWETEWVYENVKRSVETENGRRFRSLNETLLPTFFDLNYSRYQFKCLQLLAGQVILAQLESISSHRCRVRLG